jgi:MFS family permease
VSVISTAICSGILVVLLNDIITCYQIKGTQEGLMSSMISVGSLTALFTTIFLQGRFKKANFIIVSGLLATVMMIIQGIPMSFPMFLAAGLLMGYGNGGMDSCQSSFLADLNKEDTPRHMGAMHGIFGIGGVLTPIILKTMLRYYHWRTVYMIVGMVCLLLVVQFAIVTNYLKLRVSVVGKIEPKFSVMGIKKFIANKYTILLLLSLLFGAAAQSGMIVWTIRYVSLYLNSPELAGFCLSVYWIASTVSRFCSPMMPWKPYQFLTFGAITSAIIWALALVINLPIVIFVACILVGLASGSCIPMSLSEGVAINPEQTGISTSMLMIFKSFGQILSPIVVAFMSSMYDMRVGMLITAIFFGINGIFGILMIREKVKSK